VKMTGPITPAGLAGLRLLNLAQQAAQASQRKVPIKNVVVGVQGEVLQGEWAQA